MCASFRLMFLSSKAKHIGYGLSEVKELNGLCEVFTFKRI